MSQLKAIYEKTYDSIIGNCDTFTLLGSKDKETLDYVSDKLGKITARNDMNMLQNSEFLVFLAQKEDDLEIIKSRFRLSENQAKYLDIDEPGKGLIKCGKRIIPFSNLIPNDTLMYKICTTKFKDIQERIKAGGVNESAYRS